MDFVAVAQRIKERLDELEAPVAVVGALALPVYGLSRATADLDLLTLQRVQSDLVAYLEGEGYETLFVSAGFSNHLHAEASRGRVDIVYVDESTAEKVFSEARERTLLGEFAMIVPRAEHLIAMKVRAMKNDPRRQPQDLADVQALLRSEGVDRAEARRYFSDVGLEDLYDQLETRL